MVTIGITMGCPAGVGPEIILKYYSLQRKNLSSNIVPVVLGDINVLKRCGSKLNIDAKCVKWTPGSPIPEDAIPVLELSQLQNDDYTWGNPSIRSAKAMAGYIHTGVELSLDGLIDGITTCPISKASLQSAGFLYPGHTEMLVELTKATNYTMMMAGSSLKVTLATIHCSLASVPTSITKESLRQLIEVTHEGLRRDFGLSSPRIAVAGLNPHAGEEGLFGLEEEQTISPAIMEALKAGINISGPFPPDTIFSKAAAGDYDAVICMYHDQGLIPFKLLHFKDGVNVTLGLPIVRTSVDHGTAYDIAGKGVADPTSLAEAVLMAGKIANNRKLYRSAKSI